MRKEVEDFYASHGIPIDRVVIVGRMKGLDVDSIKSSAEALYDDIQSGKIVKTRMLAWHIFAKSSPAKIVKENKETIILQELESLKAMLKEHMVPWYKKLWRWLNGRG